MENDIHKIATASLEEADKHIGRLRKKTDDDMTKMEKASQNLDKKSIENFAAWRDYLHKYYVLILAFITASGIFAFMILTSVL